MFSAGNRSARWTHACERGALETWFELDEAGKIVEMSSGAVGLPPPPEVEAAAIAVIAGLPLESLPARPFQTNLGEGWVQRLGRCTLERPWVFSRDRGLFHLRCWNGTRAVLGVVLDEHGTLVRANMLRGAMYTHEDPAV